MIRVFYNKKQGKKRIVMKCRQMLWCTVICTDSRVSPQGRPGLAVRVLLFGRGVTWVPKSRNNYMPRFVFYRKMRPLFQKPVFLGKKRKSTSPGYGKPPNELESGCISTKIEHVVRGLDRKLAMATTTTP